MPTRALSMRKIRELIRLKYQAGLSHEQIAGALAISKGVVAKYVARIERAGLEPAELMGLSDAEVLVRIAPAPRSSSYGGRIAPDFAHVHAELKRPSVTLMLLWQEYTAANADGLTYRYSQFTDLYRSYVATLRRSMRQVHRAGEKLFVDYAGQTVPYGREGDRAQIFVAALGASHYTFACATAHQRLIDWTGALVRALEYIDDIPALIVPDNARALIADPDRYEPRRPPRSRIWPATTARQSCRRARTGHRTRRRSKWRCRSYSAGSWRGCVTACSQPLPMWMAPSRICCWI